MKQRLLITEWERGVQAYIVCALYDNNSLVEVYCQKKEEKTLLGNIYVGRVKDVVKNLNAVFIEIAKGVVCYYPLGENRKPIYVKKSKNVNLVQGDELLVQVEKEAVKTKPPSVTSKLSFSGKYLVLTTENTRIGVSKKLTKEEGERIKSYLQPYKTEGFGMVIRTNAKYAAKEQLMGEWKRLLATAEEVVRKAPYQTAYACVSRQLPEYLKMLQNVYSEDLECIVTDKEELYKQIQQYLLAYQPEDVEKLRKYEDTSWSLAKCYSLETHLQEALKEKVWLRSGGYLVIQPTEALTVIDVNSGKSTAKAQVQEHYLKLNIEAAKEVARQLRLRNISGIIIVDFIDMKKQTDRETLMEQLRLEVKKDPVPVQLVDMTKLNLVELTRKKVHKSLREQLGEGKW